MDPAPGPASDPQLAYPIGGIVLCGGQSRRMGRAKAWLPFGAESMLQRVTRIVTQVVQPVVVVAAREQDIPPLPSSILIARDAVNGLGPLQGLASGLAVLNGHAQAAYLSSCDAPFLKVAFIQRMIELLGDYDIVVPEAHGFRQPLAGVYRLSILPEVRDLLAAGQLRTGFLFDRCRTRVVDAAEFAEADPGLGSLWNVNSPEDYEMALKELI
jgi:molybdopterin-guanine dinucleotide biosynthesis protein A